MHVKFNQDTREKDMTYSSSSSSEFACQDLLLYAIALTSTSRLSLRMSRYRIGSIIRR